VQNYKKKTDMNLLNGVELAAIIKQEIKTDVERLLSAGKKRPHLAAILVGSDAASEVYVGHKVKACAEVGFESTLVRMPETISEDEVLAKVAELNTNPDIDGFIVQLPLPKHINADRVLEAVDYRKDVDGFHPVNMGRLALGLPCFVPATPMGIMEMLKRNNIETNGKHCVVIGRSNIVGTPMSLLLSRNTNPGNCTVTLCHSRTPNVAQHTLQADIIVVALGKAKFLTADMVKPGTVVIDVGINRIADDTRKSGSRLVGDVDFDAVKDLCSHITPVPGGVGAMTVVALMLNTLKTCQ
jgi:methylenetetrahydrofolate dehydrogenase (NADP+)/methenyltetrahydrofolate cyclohydrolase